MPVLDVILRTAGATIFLMLVPAFWSARKRSPSAGRKAVLMALFAAGAVGFLANNTPDPALLVPGPAGRVLDMASGSAALFLWWLGLALFDDDFTLGPLHLTVGALWVCLAAADRGFFGPGLEDQGLSWPLIAMAAGMIGHLLYRVLRDLPGDLIEARRSARLVLSGAMVGILLVDMAADVVLGLHWRPGLFTLAQNFAVLSIAVSVFVMVYRPDDQTLLFAARPVRPMPAPAADATEDRLMIRLERLLLEEKCHLDPELSFTGLAERMAVSQPVLRQLVNGRLGYHHFRAFLNAHRLAEAKRRLADPDRAGEKISAIALDSGFASLASFNRVFKTETGVTPSAWRAGALDRKAAPRNDLTPFERRSSTN